MKTPGDMEAKAAKHESKWNAEAHAVLCGALVDALHAVGSSAAANKDGIQAALDGKGYSFTWEAIR